MAEINTDRVIVKNTRIAKLRQYLFSIIDELLNDNKYQINANMLDKNINNYSLDKIPTATLVYEDITGNKQMREVYEFRSRNRYNQDTLNNLLNIGFFEMFEEILSSNNEKGKLPEIENIINIECLNTGALSSIEDNTAEFSIQIEIIYNNYINK